MINLKYNTIKSEGITSPQLKHIFILIIGWIIIIGILCSILIFFIKPIIIVFTVLFIFWFMLKDFDKDNNSP